VANKNHTHQLKKILHKQLEANSAFSLFQFTLNQIELGILLYWWKIEWDKQLGIEDFHLCYTL
jgi:hypothetical protein